MPTIRIRDWTKTKLEEIREEESHSSHDSVVKSLLKDREISQSVEEGRIAGDRETQVQTPTVSGEGAVPGLTVLSELETAENGVVFLWCPNCSTEVAHFTIQNPTVFDVFEIECQRCLTHLDQHALVAIELDYPLEVKLIEEELAADLKAAVIDYWDRVLRTLSRDPTLASPHEVDRLVWQFDQYAREFLWEWPAETPVVSLEPGETYELTDGDGRIEVLERVSEKGTTIDAFRIKRYAGNGEGEEPEVEVLDPGDAAELLRDRALRRTESV